MSKISETGLPADSLTGPRVFDSQALRDRLNRLSWQHENTKKRFLDNQNRLEQIESYLNISEEVTGALQQLSDKLFNDTLRILESKLTIALQEVLEQPIKFKATADFKGGAAVVEFAIERDGFTEDVYRGQGGSVQNILSVGLRMFALTQLEPESHRPFLVLDEQDCWLRPELVPHLVRIVHEAGKELGFQVLMISHHEHSLFERFADKVYRLAPGPEGVSAEVVNPEAIEQD